MGTAYWKDLFELLRERMVSEGTIDAADLDRLTLTDSPAEALEIVTAYARDVAKLRLEPRRSRILGETGLVERPRSQRPTRGG